MLTFSGTYIHAHVASVMQYRPIQNQVRTPIKCVISCLISVRSITWNYCVLDEGHIIKNTKTKVSIITLGKCSQHQE